MSEFPLDQSILKQILKDAELAQVDENSDHHGINRQIRHLAKELAGHFFDSPLRTPQWRKTFPTLKHYMRGQMVQADGSIKLYRPGWMHHVNRARKLLTDMLRPDSGVSDHLKWIVYQEILDDRERSARPGARKLHQVGMGEGTLQ